MIDERIIKLALCMPNIPFPTMGGHTFWTNLCEYQGYKLQQNQFTHHARILDSNDIRIAWGTVNGMEKTLERMANMATKSINAANMVHKKNIVDVEDQLISIKKLYGKTMPENIIFTTNLKKRKKKNRNIKKKNHLILEDQMLDVVVYYCVSCFCFLQYGLL